MMARGEGEGKVVGWVGNGDVHKPGVNIRRPIDSSRHTGVNNTQSKRNPASVWLSPSKQW